MIKINSIVIYLSLNSLLYFEKNCQHLESNQDPKTFNLVLFPLSYVDHSKSCPSKFRRLRRNRFRQSRFETSRTRSKILFCYSLHILHLHYFPRIFNGPSSERDYTIRKKQLEENICGLRLESTYKISIPQRVALNWLICS